VGGWQHFRGRGFDIDRSDSAAYLSTGVRGEYALPLGQVWHVGVAVEGQRVLSPVRLNVSGMPEGHNPAVVGALGVDVAHSF
jgi:hypothetical protein